MSEKKSKVEDPIEEDSDFSDDDDQIEMDVDSGLTVNLALMGFPPTDSDSDGIQQLLIQLFTKMSKVDIKSLTQTLIQQNTIGTVLKDDLDDESNNVEHNDDTVYAFTTCFSLTRQQNSGKALLSLREALLYSCNQSKSSFEDKNKFIEILSNCHNSDISKCSTCVGFIVNERYINLPFNINLLASMVAEIETSKQKLPSVRFDFSHYIIICKLKSESQNVGSKVSNFMFVNPEEEVFAENAELSFQFEIDNIYGDIQYRKMLLLTSNQFQKSMKEIESF